MLLYAAAGREAPLEYRLGGSLIGVRSIDLDRDWREIHRDLLGLVAELSEEKVGASA